MANNPAEYAVLPSGLVKLQLNDYNDDIDRFGVVNASVLPRNLKKLNIDSVIMNTPLYMDGVLPNSIVSINLGKCCSQIQFGKDGTGVKLPSSLLTLDLGAEFNCPIPPHTLPKGLKKLYMQEYNYPLDMDTLPDSIQHLQFGRGYTHKIRHCHLPQSLTYLELPASFDQPLEEGLFPEGLKTLYLGYKFNHPIHPSHFPTSLKKLVLSFMFNQPIHNNDSKESLLPPVEILEFGTNFDQPFGSCKVDSNDNKNNKVVISFLPRSIRWLSIGKYNQPIEKGYITDNITILHVDDPFARFTNSIYYPSIKYWLPNSTILYFNNKVRHVQNNKKGV
ncbi:hypothetical protein DFA_08910 [Cavenderia fasciculata]|uniref:FNIP repeat-containing protein n=1 Tax=Cavenderia fasciculata TaxID=261658 RepID=F4Q516_CACFS|nr:uncharacterized protein DFA_08910 [Cavenderia fasciculata]EGG17909.1 hypothetical protein DFA_08910 [Cavenderia fasciculata]|eukprot:XP_004356393.1 hypothetical protein DFA_08910 [Cavenderia fasciculata]